MLLLLTGARRNEITHARWEHVDWEKRLCWFRCQNPASPGASH